MNEYYLTPEDFQKAEENGISYNVAYNRFYSYGWSKERSITTPVKTRSNVWELVKDVCEKNGISQKLYYSRKNEGWTDEEACTLPPSKEIGKRIRNFNYKVTPKDIAEAEANGIPKNTFKCRVYGYKWSVERAKTEPVQTRYRRKEAK